MKTTESKPTSVYFWKAQCTMGQWLKWSCEAGRLTWRSQVGANPIPIPHPTNLALFGHKIALYRFNHGGSYYCRGLKSEQGAEPPLTLTTAMGESCPWIRQQVRYVRKCLPKLQNHIINISKSYIRLVYWVRTDLGLYTVSRKKREPLKILQQHV